MRLRKKSFWTALTWLLLLVAAQEIAAQGRASPEPDASEHVLMVSFDGFRSDYPQRWDLTNFQRLAREGASAVSLIPVYPSKTFPNHYTLVTGLYAGNHGLVDNSFHSRLTGENYGIGIREAVEDSRYYGGLPLWQYLQNYGIKTASYFWVGSEALIAGRYPDYYERYDALVNNETRIDQVLAWLALPDATRPRFITLYFSFVDSVAHDTGPLSLQTKSAALLADELLGKLLDGIDALPVEVDLLVVSDHGMSEVMHDAEHYIDAGTLGVSAEDVTMIVSQTQAQLYVDDAGDIEEIYQALKPQEQHFTVYRKQETPAHWHYSTHANVGDILIVADPGYVITDSLEAELTRHRGAIGSVYGVHGFDARDDKDLQGIFYARGPSIKSGVALEAFENVHVLPLITALFGVPAPDGIDGDRRVLLPVLAE